MRDSRMFGHPARLSALRSPLVAHLPDCPVFPSMNW